MKNHKAVIIKSSDKKIININKKRSFSMKKNMFIWLMLLLFSINFSMKAQTTDERLQVPNQSRELSANKPYPDSVLPKSPLATISVTDLTSLTATDLVEFLLGSATVVSGVTYTGANIAAGTFVDGINAGININEGVILSSGSIHNALGPNNMTGASTVNNLPGDSDLNTLGGGTTHDAAVLEFDFIPESTLYQFNYVMGSEEYPEYILTFFDVFGFFVNGVNIATIPGTATYVSIGTVNHTINPSYYISNDPFPPPTPYDIQCDGFTTVFTALVNVTPGISTHIKLAVADYADQILDTWVFLEEGSFIPVEDCFAATDSLYNKITSDITYTAEKVWDGKYYIDDYVTVTVDGHLLDITNVDVVFGPCAGIEFVNGGYLRANNSVFRPCIVDETWKGLHFMGSNNEFDNIVNECTFKNAEVALYFQEADAVISNNLFSNCNFGIRVEGNYNFDHPISGNHFVTDQFFPNFDLCDNSYNFLNNYSTYGIYSSQSRFPYQISQNKFINSKGNTPNTYGIYQSAGGGIFSENTFTDLHMSVFLHSQVDYSCIENNEIEVNLPAWNNPSIRIYSCQGAIVEVNNNEIWNNYNQNVGYAAIYADYSSNVSMVNNQIDGFNYGIVALFNQNCQISNNEINDCQTWGIIIYEQTYNKSYITCNTIKMKNYNNSTGLAGYGMSPQSEVSGNCITDCRVSMDFQKMWWLGGTLSLPKIRNNFLYNYTYVGINVAGLSGNIGTITDPGLNTLWSNKNAALDINSNTNITVADNFGMFNISWPQVHIVSNNPYHSTASCAHQIFNMPSQGQLNVNYTCDHFPTIEYLLNGGGGLFYLSPNYRETLKSSSNQYDDASTILANYNNSDVNLLNEIVELTTLSDNEKALLQYNFYYRNADYLNARMHLNQFNPNSTDEEDFKTLRLYDLNIIENGMGILSENDLEILRSIQDKKPKYSNFATSILNNSSSYTNYKIEEITVEDVVISGDVKHIENDESFLHIYPNPVSNTVFIELINNNSETSKLELFDMTGKLVTDYTINFVAGVIELDMQKLNEGLYFITLTDPTSGFIQKAKMIKINN